MKIIAIYGPQGAGKSPVAEAIASLPRWHRLSFAEPLYSMMSALLGTDARRLDKAKPYVKLCGKTLRHALQTLGTEWGRGMLGDTIWLHAMHTAIFRERASGAAGVVIDDLRFANEYQFLRQQGATIVRIEREGCTAPTLNQDHASEADWCDFRPCEVLTNIHDITYCRHAAMHLAGIAPHATFS